MWTMSAKAVYLIHGDQEACVCVCVHTFMCMGVGGRFSATLSSVHSADRQMGEGGCWCSAIDSSQWNKTMTHAALMNPSFHHSGGKGIGRGHPHPSMHINMSTQTETWTERERDISPAPKHPPTCTHPAPIHQIYHMWVHAYTHACMHARAHKHIQTHKHVHTHTKPTHTLPKVIRIFFNTIIFAVLQVLCCWRRQNLFSGDLALSHSRQWKTVCGEIHPKCGTCFAHLWGKVNFVSQYTCLAEDMFYAFVMQIISMGLWG